MRVPVKIPNLGAEATEARIVSWLRQVGDVVAQGEAIAEIETDKATVELEAPGAGRLVEVLAAAGTDVAVGTTIAMLEEA